MSRHVNYEEDYDFDVDFEITDHNITIDKNFNGEFLSKESNFF